MAWAVGRGLLGCFYLLFLLTFMAKYRRSGGSSFAPGLCGMANGMRGKPFVGNSGVATRTLSGSCGLANRICRNVVISSSNSFGLKRVGLGSSCILLATSKCCFGRMSKRLSAKRVSLRSVIGLTSGGRTGVGVLARLGARHVVRLLEGGGPSFGRTSTGIRGRILGDFNLRHCTRGSIYGFSVTSNASRTNTLVIISSALLESHASTRLARCLTGLDTRFGTRNAFASGAGGRLQRSTVVLSMGSVSSGVVDHCGGLGVSIAIPGLGCFVS